MIDWCHSDLSTWFSALSGLIGLAGSLAMGWPYLIGEPIAIDKSRIRDVQVDDKAMRAALDGLAEDLDQHALMIAPQNLQVFRLGIYGVLLAFLLLLLGHGQQLACG